VIEILRSTGDDAAAELLEESFLAFIGRSGAKHGVSRPEGTES
jgi:hypothetical protein